MRVHVPLAGNVVLACGIDRFSQLSPKWSRLIDAADAIAFDNHGHIYGRSEALVTSMIVTCVMVRLHRKDLYTETR